MSFIEDAMKEASKKFNRYARKTLDMEQHRADYAQWHTEFEAFRSENPSYPSLDEVYGNIPKIARRQKVFWRLAFAPAPPARPPNFIQ
jgi:hypothetical protein